MSVLAERTPSPKTMTDHGNLSTATEQLYPLPGYYHRGHETKITQPDNKNKTFKRFYFHLLLREQPSYPPEIPGFRVAARYDTASHPAPRCGVQQQIERVVCKEYRIKPARRFSGYRIKCGMTTHRITVRNDQAVESGVIYTQKIPPARNAPGRGIFASRKCGFFGLVY